MIKDLPNVKILSVNITTAPVDEQIELLKHRLDKGIATKVFTPNTQMLLSAASNADTRRILNSSDLNIPDGIGLCLAAKRLGLAFPERTSGIDCAETIMTYAAKKGYSIFLLGGKHGRARCAERLLCQKYPGLKIAGCHNGYFEKSGVENQRVIRLINAVRPDIVFVCFGFPIQEQWICNNAQMLSGTKLIMGLGGSIDIWSGKLKRAPTYIQNRGLEWLWRAVKEPHRIRILFDIPKFILYTEAQNIANKNIQ